MNKHSIFRQVRYSLYLAFILNGILVQWIIPFKFRCNFVDKKCFACGMRTAINLLLQGDFIAAYHSNKFIIGVIILCFIIILDVLIYSYKCVKFRNR